MAYLASVVYSSLVFVLSLMVGLVLILTTNANLML
jgi:hypothetical protein